MDSLYPAHTEPSVRDFTQAGPRLRRIRRGAGERSQAEWRKVTALCSAKVSTGPNRSTINSPAR
ncbi:hypothetical protein GCM10027317_26140 [Massilia agri]